MRRDWKRVSPTTLIEALHLCKDHAHERHNLSVARIAELMAVSIDALYKWLGTGRMPANVLPAYEHICGIDLASRYLALSGGNLVLRMPTGRKVKPIDVQALQGVLNNATGAILAFAAGQIDAAHALADIEAGMVGLAWHREQIARHQQPDLEFEA